MVFKVSGIVESIVSVNIPVNSGENLKVESCSQGKKRFIGKIAVTVINSDTGTGIYCLPDKA